MIEGKEYLTAEQKTSLLEIATMEGDFVLASGAHALQKFEFDLVPGDSIIFLNIIMGLRECILDNNSGFDAVLTVANGATRLGNQLGQELQVPHLRSSYGVDQAGRKRFSVSSMVEVRKVVIVDDVFTRGTNATKVMAAAESQGIETMGVVVVLDRSEIATPSIGGNIAVASLIRHQLR